MEHRGQGPEIVGAPVAADLTKPSAARIYDYLLGGNYNWEVDRTFAKEVLARFPVLKPLAEYNRAWLRRVVRAALEAGIDQFLDLGSGLPTVGNVHEIARDHRGPRSETRVVYVDNEPVAAEHAHLILEQDDALDWCGVVEADVRDSAGVLASATVQRLLDPRRPVCVLAVALLHFVDADIGTLLGEYRDHLAPGSWLAVSHVTDDHATDTQAEEIGALVSYYRSTQNPAHLRSSAEIHQWFGGMELLRPGLVTLPDWRPEREDPDADRIRAYSWCGVGEVV